MESTWIERKEVPNFQETVSLWYLDYWCHYEFYFGLARAGKARKNGLPSIWQIALQVDEFADHVRLASPPWWIQRVTFTLLRAVALLLGYRRLDFSAANMPYSKVLQARSKTVR